MNLTKEKFKNLYDKNYIKNGEISNRFDAIGNIVDNFVGIDLSNYNGRIKIFTSFEEGILEGNSKACYNNMIAKEPDSEKLIRDSWKLLAGYENEKPLDKYRIISNNFTKPDYVGNLHISGDMSIRVNGNFASNNYFFQIARFIQDSQKSNTFEYLVDNSKMVLTWFGGKDLGGQEVTKEDAFNKSKTLLNRRFPPKFLWMWANKETVIHPISLMAFRNFVDTEYGKQVLENIDVSYTPENITNMDFDGFKDVWQKISNKVLDDLEIDRTDIDAISKLSKLISEISIEETDIKNISDLLITGNKAVILWGPPGTGKTYESEQVVKEILEIDEDENNKLENYLFSNKDRKKDTNGYYEIVQFHPNYTYQDFIGGITPKLDDDKKDISYILRTGIFKRFCDEANKSESEKKKYIFIIDEINRAELSAVFGELLYGLEYRGKLINIPNFKEPFIIPKNVYIIGTMNNVDKSLVTFDLALRRRFGFFKLMPKLEVLEDVLSDRIEEKSLKQYVKKCKQLNVLISKSEYIDEDKELLKGIKNYDNLKLELGLDYQIGQAYFLKIQDFLPEQENGELQTITSFNLEKLWIYNLEPLLEEYLGMNIEDDTSTKLEKLKKEFEDIK